MNSKDLKTISKLAKISMTDAEMRALEADILKIRAMADELSTLDLENSAPIAVMTLDALRSDTKAESEDAKILVKCAPTHDGEYVTVPTAKEEVE